MPGRTRILAVLLAAAAADASAGSTTRIHDLTSGPQSSTVDFRHSYWIDISVPAFQPGPIQVVIDYLYPTSALGEWGAFQSRSPASSYSVAFPELNPTFQWFSGQWMRVTWDIPAGFNWSASTRFWVQYDFNGTRSQTLSGVPRDFAAIPGAPYTNPTANVTAPPDVFAFADECIANPIDGQVSGLYGVVQRVQAYLQACHPGECYDMSLQLAAAMRHLGIPAALAIGYMVPGSFQIPTGFGRYRTFSLPFSGSDGHAWVGGWREDDLFSPLDANNGFSQFLALQAGMIGYFEDLEDATYSFAVFSRATYTARHGYSWSNAGSQGNQTYSWRHTRGLMEASSCPAADLFAQRVSDSYYGGSGIIGGDIRTGVSEEPPGRERVLVVFPAAQRPVHPGEGLFVQIAAPDSEARASLRLFDVQGRRLEPFGFDDRPLAGHTSLRSSVPRGLAGGVYFIRLTLDGGRTETVRLTVTP